MKTKKHPEQNLPAPWKAKLTPPPKPLSARKLKTIQREAAVEHRLRNTPIGGVGGPAHPEHWIKKRDKASARKHAISALRHIILNPLHRANRRMPIVVLIVPN